MRKEPGTLSGSRHMPGLRKSTVVEMRGKIREHSNIQGGLATTCKAVWTFVKPRVILILGM